MKKLSCMDIKMYVLVPPSEEAYLEKRFVDFSELEPKLKEILAAIKVKTYTIGGGTSLVLVEAEKKLEELLEE